MSPKYCQLIMLSSVLVWCADCSLLHSLLHKSVLKYVVTQVLEVREQQRLELQRKEEEELNHRYERQILARSLQLYDQGPCSLSVFRRDGKPVELSVKFISRMTPVQANDIWMVSVQFPGCHLLAFVK